MHARRRLIILPAALALSPHVRAQASWPTKPVRVVVPFAPGGSSEIVARTLAVELSKGLGQSVYVDNKPGAAGNVAMADGELRRQLRNARLFPFAMRNRFRAGILDFSRRQVPFRRARAPYR